MHCRGRVDFALYITHALLITRSVKAGEKQENKDREALVSRALRTMRRTGALRVALLLLAALAGASEAFSPEMWTNLANWNFLYRNYITSVDPRNMPRTDASPEPTAPTPDVDVNVLSNDDDNNDSSGGSGVSARNVSLKAFLDVVPDMANHTIEDFLSDVEAASPPAEAQEPEGIVMNETLLASIRKCTKDFERESTNSTEAQPDTFAYDILQDFGSCITTSFDDGPYSNLTGIIDVSLPPPPLVLFLRPSLETSTDASSFFLLTRSS